MVTRSNLPAKPATRQLLQARARTKLVSCWHQLTIIKSGARSFLSYASFSAAAHLPAANRAGRVPIAAFSASSADG